MQSINTHIYLFITYGNLDCQASQGAAKQTVPKVVQCCWYLLSSHAISRLSGPLVCLAMCVVHGSLCANNSGSRPW